MSDINAEVIAVFPNQVRVAVDQLESFQAADESLRVGSYLKVCDNENVALICVIESFSIELREPEKGKFERRYIIDAFPLGTLRDGKFKRGGDELAIPPKQVFPATAEEVRSIYAGAFEPDVSFCFSSLTRQRSIQVPVQGDKFFSKHIAVVGATGSGKSHTVAKILQSAVSSKATAFSDLNNSHIVVFDIHGEYANAFPEATVLTADQIRLPYWLMNGEEMDEVFLESGDNNNYNQESLLRTVIALCKNKNAGHGEKVYFDSPVPYNVAEVMNCLDNLIRETKDAENPLRVVFQDGSEKSFIDEEEKLSAYCEQRFKFAALVRSKINRGTYADGSIDKFVRRIVAKIENPRLAFMFGEEARKATFEDVLRQLIGYGVDKKSNVTIIDLSGIPFEVLSIAVSLISRLLFDFGYHSRRQKGVTETPLLLVYEEAHKYAPRSNLARYKASLIALERIAKEGRKYGVTLLIATQRPSEISETIFSQSSNFLAMRLTNPDDQAFVRRLLPDALGNVTDILPALEAGEAILMGDACVLPAVVYVSECEPSPHSEDVHYLRLWSQPWKDVDFSTITTKWSR